jgi:hypothetical protein
MIPGIEIESRLKREQLMFNKKSLLVHAAAIYTCFLGVSAASAANPQCFTLASLQGSWVGVATYGANVALAFGQRYIDEKGNVTITFVLNAPVVGDPNGARAISTGSQTGTYTMNCDGTGTVNRVLTSSLGIVTNQVDNFIITGATVKNGQFVATSMVDAVQTPSALVPGGVFVTRVLTRMPDRPGPTVP